MYAVQPGTIVQLRQFLEVLYLIIKGEIFSILCKASTNGSIPATFNFNLFSL